MGIEYEGGEMTLQEHSRDTHGRRGWQERIPSPESHIHRESATRRVARFDRRAAQRLHQIAGDHLSVCRRPDPQQGARGIQNGSKLCLASHAISRSLPLQVGVTVCGCQGQKPRPVAESPLLRAVALHPFSLSSGRRRGSSMLFVDLSVGADRTEPKAHMASRLVPAAT